MRFYRDGLGINLQPNENPRHGETSWHDPYFHFAFFPVEARREPAPGLFVEDLEAAHERLVAKGGEVEKEAWGREARYRYCDPDGNLISSTE